MVRRRTIQLSRFSGCIKVLVTLGAMALAPIARAQPCGNPVANALAESSVCDQFVSISWVNPQGLVFPKVWRSPNSNFENATVVYNPGLFGTPAFVDTPPDAGHNYSYWIGGDIVGCADDVRQIPLTGPLFAGRFTPSTYPAALPVATCNGMRVSWQPARDVTQWRLVRVNTSNDSLQDRLGIFPRTTTSFLDTDARPGNKYEYAVFLVTPCGSSNVAATAGHLRAGPWASPAAQSASGPIGSTAALVVGNLSPLEGGIAAPPPIDYF